MNIPETVQSYLQQHHMFRPEDTVLAAVSGGPDSLCMLLVLLELGCRICVAHYDHGLRDESSRDAEGVSRLAEKFHLPFHVEKGDVRRYARENSQTLEEAARSLRYEFLRRCAESSQAPVIATGHTIDDQAETILMHLIRGAGVRGLQGIRPEGESHYAGNEVASGIRIVRPLLCLTREQTEGYCLDKGYQPVFDSSNQDMEYTRNRIRWELLPLLKKYNPRIVDVLYRLGEMAQTNTDCMDQMADDLWNKHAGKVKPNGWRFPQTVFNESPTAIRQALVRLAVQSVAGNVADLAYRHVDKVIQFSLCPTKSRAMDLALSIEVAVEDEFLVFRRGAAIQPEPEWENQQLPLPGNLLLENPRWEFQTAIHEKKGDFPFRKDQDPFTIFVDADRIQLPLHIRSRKKGDRFAPLGMAETVNLNDFLSSHKVSQSVRGYLPLVCDGNRIIWIPGLRINREVAGSEKTYRWVEIRVIKSDA